MVHTVLNNQWITRHRITRHLSLQVDDEVGVIVEPLWELFISTKQTFIHRIEVSQQHFTSSLTAFTAYTAGISHNKLLAKLASAMNKPNKQTIVPTHSLTGLMRDLPLKKIRGLGGKLGAVLEGMGCITACNVQALPFEQLVASLGDFKRAECAPKPVISFQPIGQLTPEITYFNVSNKYCSYDPSAPNMFNLVLETTSLRWTCSHYRCAEVAAFSGCSHLLFTFTYAVYIYILRLHLYFLLTFTYAVYIYILCLHLQSMLTFTFAVRLISDVNQMSRQSGGAMYYALRPTCCFSGQL